MEVKAVRVKQKKFKELIERRLEDGRRKTKLIPMSNRSSDRRVLRQVWC